MDAHPSDDGAWLACVNFLPSFLAGSILAPAVKANPSCSNDLSRLNLAAKRRPVVRTSHRNYTPSPEFSDHVRNHPGSPVSPSSLSAETFDYVGAYRMETTPRRPQTSTPESPASRKRTSSNSSLYHPAYSLYPAPTRPLPPVPTKRNPPPARSPSLSSTHSSQRSSLQSARSASGTGAGTQARSRQTATTPRSSGSGSYRHESTGPLFATIRLEMYSTLVSDDKGKNNTVHFLDVSSTSSIVASKHGNNIVKVWDLRTGSMLNALKFSSYTEAHSRSRDYLIKSHAVLSETSTLIAIATRFGRSIDVWNWAKKKSLQTIDGADRWAVGKMEAYDHGWGRLAAYSGEDGKINLYAATREKKPFVKMRTITLADANLPFIPQYPELALSATSPLLVAAAGPRPPRRGQPPPERETLLVAWETHDNSRTLSKPYRVARPWQHKELETAIPCDVATYGSVVVSIWIPAGFRAVAREDTYVIVPVKVPSRYVMVWDLAANSTRTFAIPNCVSCVSPDCRYVAYCHASGAAIGARGTLAIVDVMSAQEVWAWPDRNASANDSGPVPGFKQFDDLVSVTELAFSADGSKLIVGDVDGRMGVYNVVDRASRVM